MSLILDSFATEQDARRLAPSGHNANMLELRPTCENCNRPGPQTRPLTQTADYILKTPKTVSGIGAFSAAEIPSASTRRVSSGSMTPSSHRRAVE